MDSSTPRLIDLIRISGMGPLERLAGGKPEQIAVSWIAASLQEMAAGDLLLLRAEDLSQEISAQAQERAAAGLRAFFCFSWKSIPGW